MTPAYVGSRRALRGAGAGGFSPRSIPGLALWMDASTGLYQDTGATTPATADGHAVAAWVDRVAGVSFTQETGSKQPQLKRAANGINGRPVVQADGGDLLVAASVLGAASGAVFAVYRLTAPIGDTQTLIGSCDEATSLLKYWSMSPYRTAAAPNVSIRQRNNDTASILTGSTEVVAGTVYLSIFESSGTAWAWRLNGAVQTLANVSGTNNGDWTGDTADRDNTTLFAEKMSSELSFMKGDIAELLVYEPVVSADDRAAIQEYLANKYMVALA